MAKNIKSLQLLRNGAAYADKAAALSALQSASALTNVTKKDGVAVLARYNYVSGDTKEIRTLVGFYAEATDMTSVSAGVISHMTVIDTEGTAVDIAEINAKLGEGVTTGNTVSDQLSALSGTSESSSADTSVAGAKKYTDGKLDALDANSVADVNKVITDVTQSNGQITATANNITGVKLGGYAEGSDAKVADTDTLGQALGKLQGQINAMDKTASAVDGQVVTTVEEADGKVTETKANVKDLQLGGYAKGSETGAISATDTVNVALSKLENQIGSNTVTNADGSINVSTAGATTDVNVNIKSGEHVLAKDGNAGIYTDIKLSAVTTSDGTVKEEFSLVGTDGTVLGANIKIYKDSSIKEIYLGTSGDTVDPTSGTVTKLDGDKQYLNYVYYNSDGQYSITHINVSSFINEAEFASGVTWDAAAGKVRGVVDTTSEQVATGDSASGAVLTVGADGFKISNIQAAIDYSISKLDAVVTGGTTAGTASSNHVQVIVGEADGKLTGVTVTETNIANATDLAALSGKTFTVATSSNNSITTAVTNASDGTKSVDLITDADKILMSGFTAVSALTSITSADSIATAFEKVDTVITHNEEVTANALTDLARTKVDVIEVNGVASKTSAATDIVASVVIDGADIKLDGYEKASTASDVTSADTVNQAIGKLEKRLEGTSSDAVNSITVNGSTLSKTNNVASQTVVGKTGAATATGNEAIVVETDNNGNLTLGLATLDCGTY